MPDKRTSSPFVHAAQGLLMGGADVIPGVSGGTVALIVGIYERLISTLREVASAPVALIRGDRARAAEHLRAAEWGLVLPLGAGIVVAIGIGSLVIPPLMERFPAHTAAVFFGLIVASLSVPWRRIAQPTMALAAVAAGFAVLAFFLVGIPPREVADPSMPQVFGSASVAICAMILPGVSGAYLLEVLGLYRATLHALSSLDAGYVATFVAGAVLGLGVFSKLLSFLLYRFHDITMAALVGLMVGSLRALWPWLGDDRGLLAPPADTATLVVVAFGVLAFVALRLLLRASNRLPETT